MSFNLLKDKNYNGQIIAKLNMVGLKIPYHGNLNHIHEMVEIFLTGNSLPIGTSLTFQDECPGSVTVTIGEDQVTPIIKRKHSGNKGACIIKSVRFKKGASFTKEAYIFYSLSNQNGLEKIPDYPGLLNKDILGNDLSKLFINVFIQHSNPPDSDLLKTKFYFKLYDEDINDLLFIVGD